MADLPQDAVFHSDGYLRHNQARQSHFLSLGLSIEGKDVLETGAGIGDHTDFLLAQGARRVVAVEGRSSNVDFLRHKYRDDLRVQVAQVDLNALWPTDLQVQFNCDVVYCYGTLYHLASGGCQARFMAWLAGCREFAVVESVVTFVQKDGFAESLIEDPQDPSAAIDKQAVSWPSRQSIWRYLSDNFDHVYATRAQPDHEEFPLDWRVYPTAWDLDKKPAGLLRAVFVASHEALSEEHLAPYLPQVQLPFSHTLRKVT